MADDIEKLRKQAMVNRWIDKTEAAVYSLGKLARKKKGANREEVLGVLKQISAEAPQEFMRYLAFGEIGKTLTAGDREWLAFLRRNLDDEPDAFVQASLRLFRQDAYQELVDVIADKKRPRNTRTWCLEALSDHCGRRWDKAIIAVDCDEITEAMIPTKQLREWAAAGFPPPAPAVIPTKELKKLGIELPPPYAKFLVKPGAGLECETDEGQWRLFAADELLAEVNVDGRTGPAIKQLSSYAATLADVLDGDATEDDRGKPYPLKRLAAGWAIGEESSGDVLYLDPADKHSVWVFHHDGGDVERVAKSFGGWIRTAEAA